MPLDLVKTLSDLVSIASVNPMGRAASGPEFLEDRLTNYLESLFGRLGLPCQRQTVQPRRDNIVARLDGHVPPEKGGRLILLEAHQDTVPVVGMTIEPFNPVVRDGRLYGRGSCDIKGGMAAMLGAVARLAEERPTGMPTVIMACTVNEEDGHSGADALTRLWSQGATGVSPVPMGAHGQDARGTRTESLIVRRPDAAIIAEPTHLQVVVAHKGVVRWRCRAHGRATHSSQPHLGINAIYKMAPIVLALERYQRDVLAASAPHRLCDSPTLSVGTITGGLSVNTVPDQCAIDIDRRLVPGENPSEAYRHVLDFLAREPGANEAIEHEPPYLQSSGLSDEFNGPLAVELAAAARASGIGCETIGVPYGTNASSFAGADVPSVVFGPGSIDQAHTADEWVSLDQVARASEALYQFVRRAGQ